MKSINEEYKQRINTVYRFGDTLNFYGFTKLRSGVVLRIINGKIVLRPQKPSDAGSTFVLVNRKVDFKEIADIFTKHNALGRQFMNVADTYWPSHSKYVMDENEFIKEFYGDN